MEGTRPVVLVEPQRTETKNEWGEPVKRPSKQYRVLAKREDRGGTEGEISSGILGGDWLTEYIVRSESFPKDVRPTEAWTLVDEKNQELKIESVTEVNSGPFAIWLRIICQRVRVRENR